MTRRILITGCNGMLGGQLVETLSCVDDLELMGVDVDHGNLTKPDVCKTILDQTRADVVINTAAYTAVDQCEKPENSTLVHLANVTLPGNLARECKDRDALMVHISTDYVYDGKKGEPYIEGDQPNPLSKYGKSKLDGDNAIINSGCRYLIMRTAWLFGRHGHNFIEAIIKQATTRSFIEVVDDQKGNPTSTIDLSKAILKALELDLEGLYHFSCAGHATWFEYAKTILALTEISDASIRPISSEELGMKAMRPSDSRLNIDLFCEKANFEPRHWTEAVKKYLLRRNLNLGKSLA